MLPPKIYLVLVQLTVCWCLMTSAISKHSLGFLGKSEVQAMAVDDCKQVQVYVQGANQFLQAKRMRPLGWRENLTMLGG